MKYLITMQFNRAAGVDNIAALIEAGKAHFQAGAEAGNLECAYATLEHPAKVIAIVSADSHDEVLKSVATNPLASISTTCVQGLTDVSVAFESNAARVGG